MSFISPARAIHRGWNIILGDSGSSACVNGPAWTQRTYAGGAGRSGRLTVGNHVALIYRGTPQAAIGRVTVANASNVATATVAVTLLDRSCAAYGLGVGPGTGRWVMLAGLGAADANYQTSDDDGLTWTDRVMPVAASWGVCEFANGIFLAIEGNAVTSTVAYTSPDGIVWTPQVMDRAGKWTGAAFSLDSNFWIAISSDLGASARFVSKSIDNGVTWTALANAPDDIDPNELLVWAKPTVNPTLPGVFTYSVLGGAGSEFWSTTGNAWTPTSGGFQTGTQWTTPYFAQGIFFSSGNATDKNTISLDGKAYLYGGASTPNKFPQTGKYHVGFLGSGVWYGVAAASTNTVSGLC